MKKIALAVAALFVAPALFAQMSAQDYLSRYSLLVGKLGPDGVGIETLVNKWEADFPDDVDMLQDMIVAAVNGAMQLADEETNKAMAKLQGGLGGLGGIPGLF